MQVYLRKFFDSIAKLEFVVNDYPDTSSSIRAMVSPQGERIEFNTVSLNSFLAKCVALEQLESRQIKFLRTGNPSKGPRRKLAGQSGYCHGENNEKLHESRPRVIWHM